MNHIFRPAAGKALLLGLMALGLFSACSKKKDEKRSAAEIITGRWNLDRQTSLEVLQGDSTRDTYVGTANDYALFGNDRKAVVYYDGSVDTLSYQVLSDTQLELDGETLEIRDLRDDAFTLRYTENDNTGYYYESNISFRK